MRLFLTSVLLLIGTSAMAACPPLLNHTLRTIEEEPRSLCDYAGKVLLIVNTASQCGYTPQYEGLEALYRKYRSQGLVVLGFPMNDFGGQEPGSNKEIASFCINQYAVDFPMFAKTDLARNALFAELSQATGQAPRWNFHKYVVDRGGKPVAAFPSALDPGDPKLVTLIEKLLRTP